MFPCGWRRLPRLAAGFALMAFAVLYLGETPLGWAIAILGVAIFLTGTQGLCLACAVTGCKVRYPAQG
jgi:hypothetical protein